MGIAYNTSVVRDGLVMHLDAANVKSYPGSGTTWFDISGNGIDASFVSSPTYNSNNPEHFTFDGASDYMTFTGHVSHLNSLEDVSFEIVLNHTADPGISGLFQIGAFTGLYLDSGYINIQTNGDNSGNLVTLAESQWYHIICTFKSGIEYRIYVNGILESTVSTVDTTYVVDTTGTIATRQSTLTDTLNGKISVARLYNRLISESEVKQNFEALRGRYGI